MARLGYNLAKKAAFAFVAIVLFALPEASFGRGERNIIRDSQPKESSSTETGYIGGTLAKPIEESSLSNPVSTAEYGKAGNNPSAIEGSSLQPALERGPGRGKREIIRRCEFCGSEYRSGGSCPTPNRHKKCEKCPYMLLKDGHCPNAANHRKADNRIFWVVGLIVAAMVLWLWWWSRPKRDTLGPEWQPDQNWRSPLGNDEILFSPPLEPKDGGNGGQGKVCRARRKVGGKLEKIPYILKYPGPDMTDRGSVMFEAQALGFLEKNDYGNAPVCRGRGTALSPELREPWYAMSCARGRSLYDFMEERKGRQMNGESRKMLKALCSALLALHRIGVCHRDIKPRNIFWDGSRITLIDFGSARIPGAENPVEGNLPMSAHWKAPEQDNAGAPVGQMADIYSFGLIFCSVALSLGYLNEIRQPREAYGEAVAAAVGADIAEIVFGKVLAWRPEDRAGALYVLDAALKRVW